MQEQQQGALSGTGLMARVYWIFLGNVLLVFLLILIVEKHEAFPSFLDGAYWVALASLIVIRYVDIRLLNGQTGEGKPATMAHWSQYARIVGAVAGGVWIAVRLMHSLP
jgi:hypothetical protein